MKIHFSSSAFRGEDNIAEKWKRCQEKVHSYGWEGGIQLHNTESREVIDQLAALEVPMSVHGPFLQDRNWNLSRRDAASSLARIDENVRLYRSMGIRECVFHAGIMSDCCPEAFGHGKSFAECMREAYREELSLSPERGLNRDFTKMEEFALRQTYLKKHLALLRERYEDMLFCVENDFPAFGCINMYFTELVKLEHPVCLDTGHLWISCRLGDRDFKEEVRIAAQSGLVKMCHFHESVWKRSVPREQWSDGHQPLSCRNEELDLKWVLQTLVAGGVDLFVLEFPWADPADVEIFSSYLDS